MKKKIVLLVLTCLFILDFILVITSNVTPIDNTIYDIVISLKSDFFTTFFIIITFLASTKFIIFSNILIIIYMIIKKRKDLSLIVIASITSVVINNLIKFIVKRERPIDIALIEETFYSFPSGHAMISCLFYGSIIYLLMLNRVKYYKFISVWMGLFILLIGVSRIYLGVHYASDIIGGYLLSGIILISLSNIMNKYLRGEV